MIRTRSLVVLILTFVYIQLVYFSLKDNQNHINIVNQYSNALNDTLSKLRTEHAIVTRTFSELSKSSNNKVNFVSSDISDFQKNLPVQIKSTQKPSLQPKYKSEPLVQNFIRKTVKALIFTMDSISSYEEQSLRGGAAGELLIRHSLENALRSLGVQVDVKGSDEEFERSKIHEYQIIILDPWTWAARGWVPKPIIRGYENRIFILDFFGTPKLRGKGLGIPNERILTAFGAPWYNNTFLGYAMSPESVNSYKNNMKSKKAQGVIWGKDPKHFDNKISILRTLADKVKLISTATTPVFEHSNIIWKGHQTSQSWVEILAESRFLLGLGSPLLGPSAIDAVSMGCMYINPVYEKPLLDVHLSQHFYAKQYIGDPYVCSAELKNISSVMACVDRALNTNLKPHIPSDFSVEAHRARVRRIFLNY